MPNTYRAAIDAERAGDPGADEAGGAPPSTAAPLLEFFGSLRRHRRLIIGVALPAALAAAVFCVLRTRQFASASSFIPQSKDRTSGLAAVAAQYGVTVGNADAQASPAFYVDLLTSNAILRQVAARPLGPDTPGGGRSVADLYQVTEERAALRREEAVKALRKHLAVTLVPRSGIIRVVVTSPDAAASQEINRALLALLNDFNLNTRRSQAKAEHQFAEERLARVRQDLRAAEDRLELFYRENRVYESSPTLTLAQTRLTRDADLQRQLNATLAQQAEQAKLDEVRDTPVITVLEDPDRALKPEPRGTVRFTLFALIGGGVLGVLLALFLDTVRRAMGVESASADRVANGAGAAVVRRGWTGGPVVAGAPAD